MQFERLSPSGDISQLDGPEPVWIFKHSLTCPVSARAMAQVSTFRQRHPGVRVVLIEVQRERLAVRAVADHFEVPHASPQVILALDGTARWTASQFGISADALERSLARVRPTPSSRPA
ncbi:MAG: DUF2847 family protein [Gemmatimonadota bacterium]|nr:DUF2847 family protein [Gemmatimonadota bacterium]MDE3126406.1 DUF2847 family protein [Gemmatimonadota bacterium]